MPLRRGRHSAPSDETVVYRPMGLDDGRKMAFGSVVRRLRLSECLEVEALAERVGLAVEELDLIENSEVFPDFDLLFALANALRSDPAEMLLETRALALRRLNERNWFGVSQKALAS